MEKDANQVRIKRALKTTLRPMNRVNRLTETSLDRALDPNEPQAAARAQAFCRLQMLDKVNYLIETLEHHFAGVAARETNKAKLDSVLPDRLIGAQDDTPWTN